MSLFCLVLAQAWALSFQRTPAAAPWMLPTSAEVSWCLLSTEQRPWPRPCHRLGPPAQTCPTEAFFLVLGGSISSRTSPPPLGHLLLNPPSPGCCRILCQAGISVRHGALHQCQRGPSQPLAAAPPCMPNAGLRHRLTGHSHRTIWVLTSELAGHSCMN